jgi:hypothetical protein
LEKTILLGILALLGGCDVTPEKIETWKGTEKGPGRLREAVKNGSLAPDLRGMAVSALAELGMMGELEEDLKAVAEADQKPIVKAAVPLLVKLAQAKGEAEGTTRVQRNAKDALFLLRDRAAPEDRNAIDDALIAWTTVDLSGRMSAGGSSSDRILTAIGARAGARLVEVIGDAKTTPPSRMEAAKLVGKIGDKATREQAGVKLVELARKERQPPEATLQQIGLVGGDHAVAYLTQLAEDGHQTAVVRQKSLFALAQATPADPAGLPAALRVAGDKKAPGEVRDAAFELAEKIGSQAVGGLLKLLDDKDEQVRWRAVEAALKAGRESAVVPVLEGLSQSGKYPKDDLRSFVVHDLELIGASALPPLREELKSKSWVARLTAVEGIERLGKADDAARVEALAGDGAKLAGWPAGTTLGAEAKTVAVALKARK